MLSISDAKRTVSDLFVMGSFEDVPVSRILEVLQLADDLYFNEEGSELILEDGQYDALKQYAQRLAPTDVYFTGVGSAVRGGKVKLPYVMGSLDQVYQGDYAKWVADNKLEKETVIDSDKLDGASNMMLYAAEGTLQIAYSRGDGERGADITRHFVNIPSVPKQINNGGEPITVRAETIISPYRFSQLLQLPKGTLRREYKNPRNAASGMMNASELNAAVYPYIDVIAYEIVGSKLSKLEQLQKLEQLGFNVVPYRVHTAGDMNDAKWTDILNDRRMNSKYELDGVVIEVVDPATRARLANPGSLNPGYARKFKVADASNLAIATVAEVEWNISKDGYFKPRVKIEPINLVGVTITYATGFNAKFINENKIGPGAKVKITRSGDVIPFILEVVQPAAEAQMPDEDYTWTDTKVDAVVADVLNNATVKFERLNDFFASIDVPHLGEGNLRQMFDMGFETPESIISLTLEDMQSLVNSRPIGKKIFDNMRAKFTNIPMYVLMGSHSAFGRGVGVRKMKKLYEAFAGDMSKCASVVEIIQVEGFEHKTASKIANGYATFQEFVAKINKYVTFATYEAPKTGSLSGKTFVFTGFRNAELEKKVLEIGGKMGSTVSSKTSFLVTSEPNSTSTKAVKAREIGVAVISVDELKAML